MLKNLLWKLFGKKYLLGGAVEVYRLLEGKKTTLVSVSAVAVYIGKILGYIPPDLADQILTVLGGMGTITAAEKMKRWDEELKLTEKVGELKAEAIKQLEADGIKPKQDDAVRG